MSPRSSLTTNVLPSRILTRPSLTRATLRRARAREQPLHAHEQPPVAFDLEVAAQHRRDGVQPPGDDLVEHRLVGAHDALRLAASRRDGDVPSSTVDEPAPRPPPVDDVEARRAGRLAQQRLVPARRELGEEALGRIVRRLAHRRNPSTPSASRSTGAGDPDEPRRDERIHEHRDHPRADERRSHAVGDVALLGADPDDRDDQRQPRRAEQREARGLPRSELAEPEQRRRSAGDEQQSEEQRREREPSAVSRLSRSKVIPVTTK